MEKMIYNERALRTFKANFEKVKANLAHIHECDLGLVDFRSELVVRLYKACDYRCLYRFMPVHEMTMMEQGRLISKCSDYIVRDFICYFINDDDFYCDCLGDCLNDDFYKDDDFEGVDHDGDSLIWAEIVNLKNPRLWFDGLSDEMKSKFEEDKRKILNRYSCVGEDDAIAKGMVMRLRDCYGMGWKTVMAWVKEHHRLDELKRFICDTYVKKDVRVVVGKKLEEHIEFRGDGEDWWLKS